MSTVDLSTANWYWACPLSLFNCYSDDLDLVENVQIRRGQAELLDYIGKYCRGVGVKYVAILPYDLDETPQRGQVKKEFEEKSDLLFDLVTSLRLCHKGMISAGPLITVICQNSIFLPLTVYSGVSIHPEISETDIPIFDLVWPTSYPFEYKLQPSDVPIINTLIRQIRASRKEGTTSALFEALSRFNSAYHGNASDRLIDQMIAFESLFIGDDKELGYKLALRTSFLLAKNEAKRKAIFSDMKKAYDLRGNVVHGGKLPKQSELEGIIVETEEYLRQSIKKLLMLSKNHSLDMIKKGKNKKLAELDENILSNGNLLATE